MIPTSRSSACHSREHDTTPEEVCAELASVAVERHGDARILFTAPHGVYLRREVVTANGPAFETHVPGRWTSFIALASAHAAHGSSMTWHRAARERSKATRTFDPSHVDPNCVSTDIAGTHNWGVLLRRFADGASFGKRATDGDTRAWFHVDVHGRRDPEVSHETLGPGDVDMGTGALRADRPELADALTEALGRRLRAFFRRDAERDAEHEARPSVRAPAFRVDETPIPRGARDDGRVTLSRQGVRLGLVSAQLELSLRLRLVLKDDPERIRGFARAVAGAREDVASVGETRRGNESSRVHRQTW